MSLTLNILYTLLPFSQSSVTYKARKGPCAGLVSVL